MTLSPRAKLSVLVRKHEGDLPFIFKTIIPLSHKIWAADCREAALERLEAHRKEFGIIETIDNLAFMPSMYGRLKRSGWRFSTDQAKKEAGDVLAHLHRIEASRARDLAAVGRELLKEFETS